MKRLHVHMAVENLDQSIRFYSTLFAAEPTVVKPDYAKWMLEDPRVNFAISTGHEAGAGLSHLGIQVESADELAEVYGRLKKADAPVLEEGLTTCCYAKSEKSWIADPAGVAWEAFHTVGESTTYGTEGAWQTLFTAGDCCAPSAESWEDKMTDIRQAVREKYSQAAQRVGSSCCGERVGTSPITSNLYAEHETSELPEAAVLASLGCGNPTALAELNAGETVLDLGSGGGIDVLLSARRVGPSGKAYGLDMTDEMLALARENQKKAGAQNVEFLKGEIEHIPLPDSSVDVIISNCVINLSGDKDQVLRESFRVLKPGGRFAVSDVVTRGAIPEELRRDMLLWVGCIAGALEETQYRAKLAAAGFEAIAIEPTRVYRVQDAREFLTGKGIDVDAMANAVDGKVMSAFVRAVKPRT